jgi:hypothetical protein
VPLPMNEALWTFTDESRRLLAAASLPPSCKFYKCAQVTCSDVESSVMSQGPCASSRIVMHRIKCIGTRAWFKVSCEHVSVHLYAQSCCGRLLACMEAG